MEYNLKRLIQKKLHEKQERIYEKELKLQKDSYAAFLRIYEAGKSGDMIMVLPDDGGRSVGGRRTDGGARMKPCGHTAVICTDSLTADFLADQTHRSFAEAEYLLFAAGEGLLSAGRLPEMEAFFEGHPKTQVVYFHTDETDRNGRRSNPRFLPEWSPDTLASFFYFGDCFAVRAEAFREAASRLAAMLLVSEPAERPDAVIGVRELLYAAVLLLTAQEPAALMDVVMYHKLTDPAPNTPLRNAEWEGLLFDRIWSGLFTRSGVSESTLISDGTVISSGTVVSDGSAASDGTVISGAARKLPAPADMAWTGRWAAYANRGDVCLEGHMVSILIPSKDHPEILRRCVESIRRQDKKETGYKNRNEFKDETKDEIKSKIGYKIRYEIIVIDNGSKAENRSFYEAYADELGYRYEYRPMEFNFSKMCNIAAGLAGGEYYLFLNDDMEVLSGDWLAKMLEFAALSHVGAVGAKLLYPDTALIQHAGITNMYEGPAHKLLKYDDGAQYYDGRNRGVWDVIGVTAACLMISKEKFDQAGGFAEELKVAYNDVDLCFRLHQKGLFNVVRNDLILYHHESLSRGNDHLDPAKKERLAAERKTLYRRSPGYYDYDPFYSRHLTGASEAYECTLPYENRNIPPVGGVKKLSGKAAKRFHAAMNETLIIQVDTADRELFAGQGQTPGYLIDLHAHVRGLDSCDYGYRMILKGQGGCYEIPAVRRLRPDVEKTIGNEKHVELSGFVARIPEKMLPPDTYEIWMEAKSAYSRQRLCNKADRVLTVAD